MRLIPMSVGELALDLFFEGEADAMGQYRRRLDPRAEVGIRQIWCRVDVAKKK